MKFEKQNQHGRSMIEMLGVLAIIGVLSVGGIAGFSKAMAKYRLNKFIDQMTIVAANIRTLYGSQRNYDGINNIILARAKVFPDEMVEDANVSAYDGIRSVYGERVSVGYIDKNTNGDKQAFQISTYADSVETCLNILSQDWSGVGATIVTASSSNYRENVCFAPPMSPLAASKICELVGAPSSDSTLAPIEMYFYFDVNPRLPWAKSCLEAGERLVSN